MKSNSITVTLKKADSKAWTTLIAKVETAGGPSYKPMPGALGQGPEGGAEQSLMEMMKDLYNKGDDEMKKTISESWTKAQTGKLDMPDPSKLMKK